MEEFSKTNLYFHIRTIRKTHKTNPKYDQHIQGLAGLVHLKNLMETLLLLIRKWYVSVLHIAHHILYVLIMFSTYCNRRSILMF